MSHCFAGYIKIGDKELNFPAPRGYVALDKNMGFAGKFEETMVAEGFDLLAIYIPEKAIADELIGKNNIYERFFILQIKKENKKKVHGQREFSRGLLALSEKQESLRESLQSKFEEYEKRMKEQANLVYDLELSFRLKNMIPLKPHSRNNYLSDKYYAYSMLVKFDSILWGMSEETVSCMTETILNVSGKIVSMVAYGGGADLEWTRSASRNWSDRVLDKNVPPPEYTPIDYSYAKYRFKIALLAGLVVGTITFVIQRVLKAKKRKQEAS